MKNNNQAAICILILVASVFTSSAYSQEGMQRDILGAGMLLGINETMLELNSDSNEILGRVEQNRVSLISRLNKIITNYQAPFSSKAMQDVRDKLKGFDVKSRMPNSNKAFFFKKVYSKMKEALAMTYSTGKDGKDGFNKELTCDSALLDLAYYFGKGWVNAQYNNKSGLLAARKGMKQARVEGLECAEKLGCSFFTRSFLDGLNLDSLNTASEFKAAAEQMNSLSGNTTGSKGDVKVPSTTGKVKPKMSDPDLKSFTGTWLVEEKIVVSGIKGNLIITSYGGGKLGRRIGEYKTSKVYVPALKKKLYPGRYLYHDFNWSEDPKRIFWITAYLELSNETDSSGEITGQELKVHYDNGQIRGGILWCNTTWWRRCPPSWE